MYQKLTVIGNLGRDPEMKYTATGTAVCNFTVATSNKYTNAAGEKVQETIWFRISAFGRQAEICNQYLHKGNRVYLEGRLKADENGSPAIWTDKEGQPHASYDVVADTVKFLSERQPQPETDAGDNIPF